MPSLSARQVIHRRRTRREAAHTGFARVWRLLVTLLLVIVTVAIVLGGIAPPRAFGVQHEPPRLAPKSPEVQQAAQRAGKW